MLPMSFMIIDKKVTPKPVVKRIAPEKKVNFNCRLKLNNFMLSKKLWKNHQQLDFNFVAGIKGQLNAHKTHYQLAKYLPNSKKNLTGHKVLEKLSVGYLEDAFSLKHIKNKVENVQPSFSNTSESGSYNFKIDALQTQASAIYKSSFEAKLILDFNLQNTEVVLSQPLAKNTSVSFNMKNTDLDQRQTVNLALRW